VTPHGRSHGDVELRAWPFANYAFVKHIHAFTPAIVWCKGGWGFQKFSAYRIICFLIIQ